MSATNTVPVGPFHPLLEEAEYFYIVVDGETVVDIDLDIGWMHRGTSSFPSKRPLPSPSTSSSAFAASAPHRIRWLACMLSKISTI